MSAQFPEFCIVNRIAISALMEYSVLAKQDAESSNGVISILESFEDFKKLSLYEADLIMKRDKEDDDKLAKGIQISIDNGAILKQDDPPKYIQIDVKGKTPDMVCDEMLAHCGDAAIKGCVIVLVGLSGTGKGTTMARLKERLPNAVTWSNGNVFRSLTLLAATWCEQQGLAEFDAAKALTKENLASFRSMLSFEKLDGQWDIVIKGLGLDLRVSQVQNTELKAPKVAKNIPTVAEQTQGPVVLFASDACNKMGADGQTVLLEGREATVNYVPSPHRFVLTMSDPMLIGQRRAAQRLAGEVVKAVPATAEAAAVEEALKSTLAALAKDI